MNANSIWTGEEYAWQQNRPKGTFARSGVKVKAVSLRRSRQPGNERLSAEVLVERIVGEGDTAVQFWVPAREIVDFWDNYETELEDLRERETAAREKAEEDRKIRVAQYARERQEREEAMERERQEKLRLTEERIVAFAELTKIPRNVIISVGEETVVLNRRMLESLGG